MKTVAILSLCCALFSNVPAQAQEPPVAVPVIETQVQVPPMAPTVIPLRDQLLTATGAPRTGTVLLTISLYAQHTDGAPMWVEQQTVTLDAAGRYAVQFGAVTEGGLPASLFLPGAAALWAGVAVTGEPEGPRARLISQPYAARAAYADSLGGRSLADFVLNEQVIPSFMAALQILKKQEGAEGGGGEGVMLNSFTSSTPDVLAKFVDAEGTVGDSAVIDVGGKIGIGTTSPGTKVDIVDNEPFRVTGANPELYIVNTLAGAADWTIASYISGISNSGFSIVNATAGQTFLAIQDNGYVGMGTSSPGTRLDIVDNEPFRVTGGNPELYIVNTLAGAADWAITAYLNGTSNSGFGIVNATTGSPRRRRTMPFWCD